MKSEKVTDKVKRWQIMLSCGCRIIHIVAPPTEGDILTCIHHGRATVINKVRMVKV